MVNQRKADAFERRSDLGHCGAFLYKENHRLRRWFQKAFAKGRKNILLWRNRGGLPTASKKTKEESSLDGT